MSKFIVQMVNAYTGDVLDTEDEIFDNEQDAEDYARECSGALQKAQRFSTWQGRHTPRQKMLILWLRRSMTRIDFPV